jgi:hypothetical protein
MNLSFCFVRHLALGLVLVASCCTASAEVSPPVGYKLSSERDLAFTSPDGATKLMQYSNEMPDLSLKWQVWARRGKSMSELKPGQDYPAGFRFTNDSKWLVRMQKIGSGSQKLYLYHLDKGAYVSATKKPISDLAWAFFKSRPESNTISEPTYHISADLVKGTEEAYRWLGVNWPDNRYIVISLSGEIEAKHPKNGVKSFGGWRCRYDLASGKFDVPPVFAKGNAKALSRGDLR